MSMLRYANWLDLPCRVRYVWCLAATPVSIRVVVSGWKSLVFTIQFTTPHDKSNNEVEELVEGYSWRTWWNRSKGRRESKYYSRYKKREDSYVRMSILVHFSAWPIQTLIVRGYFNTSHRATLRAIPTSFTPINSMK